MQDTLLQKKICSEASLNNNLFKKKVLHGQVPEEIAGESNKTQWVFRGKTKAKDLKLQENKKVHGLKLTIPKVLYGQVKTTRN